jgi:hypothetical protein
VTTLVLHGQLVGCGPGATSKKGSTSDSPSQEEVMVTALMATGPQKVAQLKHQKQTHFEL